MIKSANYIVPIAYVHVLHKHIAAAMAIKHQYNDTHIHNLQKEIQNVTAFVCCAILWRRVTCNGFCPLFHEHYLYCNCNFKAIKHGISKLHYPFVCL